jgi:electron transfer flavoprotein beta subunit
MASAEPERASVHIAVIAGQSVFTDVAVDYDDDRHDVDPDDVVFVPNAFGLGAVEAALRLKETAGGGTVTVISAGPERVKDALRHYLAMGADNALLVPESSPAGDDAYTMARSLAYAIRTIGGDLVLCEGQTMDATACSVYLPPYLGVFLGWPQISGVTSIELPKDGGQVVAQRKLRRGDRELVRSPLPAVLGIEKEINEPRYPGFPQSLASLKRLIDTLGAGASLGSAGGGLSRADTASPRPLVERVAISRPRRRVKKGLVIDTSLSAAERMRIAMSGGVATKSARQTLLEGSPRELAEKLAALFERQGLLTEEAGRPKPEGSEGY